MVDNSEVKGSQQLRLDIWQGRRTQRVQRMQKSIFLNLCNKRKKGRGRWMEREEKKGEGRKEERIEERKE